MQQKHELQSFQKKAFEIAHAAFRVGASIENRVFSEHLEAWGLNLLEAVNGANQEHAHIALVNLEYLIDLAEGISLLDHRNAELFLSEIKSINSAIAELPLDKKEPDIDLSQIFNRIEPDSDVRIPDVKVPENVNHLEEREVQTGSGAQGNSAIRQSAIAEKIRQNGICRLKDFQDMFPDVSERTLRYDLQNLIEQEIVLRIGSSGPATAYRLKENEA